MSLIFLMMVGLVFWVPGLGHSADKTIHVGNVGAFAGDGAAPCMEIFDSSESLSMSGMQREALRE